jgi:hypothetical protein
MKKIVLALSVIVFVTGISLLKPLVLVLATKRPN